MNEVEVNNEKKDEQSSKLIKEEISENIIPVPTSKEGKSDEVYEVKKIFEHICAEDGIYLKVRWEGYGSDEDSWEPEQDLTECANELVSEYFNSLSTKKKSELKRFRKSCTLKKTKKESNKKTSEKFKSRNVETKRSKRRSTESFTVATKKNRKDKRAATKDAVKSYDTSSSAKNAAFQHRQTWLADSGSSDDENNETRESSNERSFDDEIKSKVSQKKEKLPHVVKSPEKNEVGTSDQVPDMVNVKSQSISVDEGSWKVEGVVEQVNNNEKKVLVLLLNSSTLERKVCDPFEAFKICGWNMCQYLLERCIFEK